MHGRLKHYVCKHGKITKMSEDFIRELHWNFCKKRFPVVLEKHTKYEKFVFCSGYQRLNICDPSIEGNEYREFNWLEDCLWFAMKNILNSEGTTPGYIFADGELLFDDEQLKDIYDNRKIRKQALNCLDRFAKKFLNKVMGCFDEVE